MPSLCHELHVWASALPLFGFPFEANALPLNGLYLLFEKGEAAHGPKSEPRIEPKFAPPKPEAESKLEPKPEPIPPEPKPQPTGEPAEPADKKASDIL
jgi:hypothetical protein